MATWTTIPDSSLEPGKPIRSIDTLALRDNPVAIAEGADGAPRIAAAALQTGTPERDWVLARTSAAPVGAVGTYALLFTNTGLAEPGTTRASSGLWFSSAFGQVSSTRPSGTWRCMGYSSAGDSGNQSTVWLRIA